MNTKKEKATMNGLEKYSRTSTLTKEKLEWISLTQQKYEKQKQKEQN